VIVSVCKNSCSICFLSKDCFPIKNLFIGSNVKDGWKVSSKIATKKYTFKLELNKHLQSLQEVTDKIVAFLDVKSK